MKIRNRFTLIGSLAVLSTAPVLVADEAVEPQIAIHMEVSPVDFSEEPIIAVCPGFEGEDVVSIDPVLVYEYEEGEGTYSEEETFEDEETYTDEETFEDEETYTDEETYEDEETYTEEEVVFKDEETYEDGEVVEASDGGEEVDSGLIQHCGDHGIPLDWIKRRSVRRAKCCGSSAG